MSHLIHIGLFWSPRYKRPDVEGMTFVRFFSVIRVSLNFCCLSHLIDIDLFWRSRRKRFWWILPRRLRRSFAVLSLKRWHRSLQTADLVCCSVLQCAAVCCSFAVLLHRRWHMSLQLADLVYCGVLQCVAVCCSVLQCVAVCCSVLQCVEL